MNYIFNIINIINIIIQSIIVILLLLLLIWSVTRFIKINFLGFKDGEYVEDGQLKIYRNNKLINSIILYDVKLIRTHCIVYPNKSENFRRSTQFYLFDKSGNQHEIYNSITTVKKYFKENKCQISYETIEVTDLTK